MRYPGHCAQMRLLMNDLKLNHDRATLKRVLENAVPQTLQDVVIVYVAVAGKQDGELREENYVNKIYPQMIAGRLWSAIQVTTAAGITAVVDLVLHERRPVSRLRAAGGVRAAPTCSPTASASYYADGRRQGGFGARDRRQRSGRPAARCSAGADASMRNSCSPALGLDRRSTAGAWSRRRRLARRTRRARSSTRSIPPPARSRQRARRDRRATTSA